MNQMVSKLLSSGPQRSAGRFLSAVLVAFALAAAAPQASAQLVTSDDFYTLNHERSPRNPQDAPALEYRDGGMMVLDLNRLRAFAFSSEIDEPFDTSQASAHWRLASLR